MESLYRLCILLLPILLYAALFLLLAFRFNRRVAAKRCGNNVPEERRHHKAR